MKPILVNIQTMSNRHRKQIGDVSDDDTDDGVHSNGFRYSKRIGMKEKLMIIEQLVIAAKCDGVG